MTEDEARSWLAAHNVPRETIAGLQRFETLLREEAQHQNLIAASTLDQFWARHVVDSAQLLRHAGQWSSWLDLGSGAGFPGLVIAALGDPPVTLVESRTKRVAFLHAAAAAIGIADKVEIIGSNVQQAPQRTFDVISARAFAPLPKLLALAVRFATPATRWVLPKGRRAPQELEDARASWQGAFTLIPSITDSGAFLIVAAGVAPRKRR